MKEKTLCILATIILTSIIISICVIDTKKLIWILFPISVGFLCMLAEYKEKIEINVAIDIFLSSCGIVLLIYFRIISEYVGIL